MASPSRIRKSMTLEEFLKLPDEKPSLEHIDGRVEAKVSPPKKQSRLRVGLSDFLDRFAKPEGLGLTFVELRCTFAGRSIVPDVVFLLGEHIGCDEGGEFVNETLIPPDIHIEIISPGQAAGRAQERLAHSTSHGCSLGWLIHAEKKWIDVYQPGRPPERLSADGVLEGEPVLPGFRLPVAEVFGWLKPWGPGPNAPPDPGADPA
jgi:Uma2 family endonuclease